MHRKLKEKDVIFLIGYPGCGKTTAGEFFERMGYVFLDSSTELTEIEKNDPVYGPPIARAIADGELVDDNIVIKALTESLKTKNNGKDLVLTGFLRTTLQARLFPKILEGLGYNPFVGFLNVSLEVAKERMKNRGRIDDKPEIMGKRISNYDKHNPHVVIELMKSGYTPYTIGAEVPPDRIYAQIQKKLSFSKR